MEVIPNSRSRCANETEREKAANLLGDFVPEGSRGMEFVKAICEGKNLTRESLIALGDVFAALTGITFEKKYKRQRALIIKWFDEHVQSFEPLRLCVTLQIAQLTGDPNEHDEVADFDRTRTASFSD
jgi:hypothetical protein